MDRLFHSHVKAFLISHQIGEDPEKNLAKVKLIANTNPARWDGKLPTNGIRPDTSFCAVVEAGRTRPVEPWHWYSAEREPVPETVEDLYEKVVFDFSIAFPKAWIYLSVEPSEEAMRLLARQDPLKGFILMSLVNATIPRSQRANKRMRLATAIASPDMRRVFTFVAFKEDEPGYRSVPRNLPVLSRIVHPSSNTATWNIRLAGQTQIYGSFQEIVPAP